ncbi:uncharacterized protein LOC100891320 [Strongylocentrotus purpuratus]|uniref:Uncharacterized protein n=1 Tax=Strongylocentrotus purpuratus TaxID=7668 RepID=A0A7M7N1M4_STRPU|nr:uncharacterized protein LOC100891320 [Strongylocentrotus purpuratus]
MERPKLPKFSGDVREFATFRSDFHHLIDTRYSKRDAVTILRTCLQGKPLDMIRGVGNDYDAAWAYLNSVFGDRRFIADAIIYDVNSFRDLRDGEDSRFCDLVHLLRRSFNTLKEVGCPQDIDNSQTLALIERKMTLEDRKVWFRHVESADKDVSLQHLLDWMETEMMTRMRATAPLRSATSSSRQKSTVHHVSAEDSKQRNDSNQYTQYKCWICKSSEHWVDHCKKVLSKSQTERFQLMRDNHACFSCLKKAGREHNMRTCKRRKRCSKEINGEQCSSFHHPLLHREVQTRSEIVASVAGKSALLPVVMVKVLGPNQKSSTVNCLLDSGAQISLVKQSMAEDMGLVGKPITINITKIGGHVEEVQTKLYRMRLQSLKGKQAYGVSALGLECINDNVAEVRVDELARTFHLKKDLLHRGFGSIDVLVGTDHAKLHKGETRERGNMLARHSPLGWVVFGATSKQQPTKSTVMNVMLANSVDFNDFWTTEPIEVCHDPVQCHPSGISRQEAEVNVADDLTQDLSEDEFDGRWQHGPDFLCQPKSEWPEEPKLEGKVPEVESERGKEEQSVLIVTNKEDVIDCKRFFSWRKLIGVTLYVLKFVRKLRSKCRKEIDVGDNDNIGTLTPDELEKGEAVLIQSAKKSLKGRDNMGELKALSAHTDGTGITRVGGRVDRAEMSFGREHPDLLPFKHDKFTRHVHNSSGHTGVAASTAKARRRYRILKGHRLAKTVKFRCAVCGAFDHKAESQEMTELPRERLAPHTPPVLFTCLHLEFATECSAMEFVQVLRQIFALRGKQSQIWSDNSTQFVGAQRVLKEFCTVKGTKWTFIAPHHNGCAESLVKSCKSALKRAIGEQILTPFDLYTCLIEVANPDNQPPIGRIPTDPDDGSYLSPNDMLLGCASSDVAQEPFRETKNPRHRVELIQRIADAFWQRLRRDVLPLLTPRWKWNIDRRNFCVDDIVFDG